MATSETTAGGVRSLGSGSPGTVGGTTEVAFPGVATERPRARKRTRSPLDPDAAVRDPGETHLETGW